MGERSIKVGNDVNQSALVTGDASKVSTYRAHYAIAERLVKLDPNNAGWQRGLSISHNKIGDMQVVQGDLAGALQSYRMGLAIAERLAKLDPDNAGWQRDLIVNYIKMSEVAKKKSYVWKALETALAMQRAGTLAPVDAWMIDDLEKRAGWE